MDEIVTIMRNNVVVHSLRVAKHFHKRHDRVLRAIENLIAGLPQNGETPNRLMRRLRAELDSKGLITLAGVVPKHYFMERMGVK